MPSLLDTVHFDRGPWFLPILTVSILAVAGVAVLISRKPELIRKWRTWVLIAPAVGVPTVLGPGTTAAFAAALAVVAVIEYGRLVRLSRADTVVLIALAVAYPVAAWLRPSLLGFTPLLVLLCAVPAVLSGDIENGARRTAFTAFGSIWICWALAHLVLVWPDAFLVCFAVAATDVAAWCGGKGLRFMAWARRPISPLSPNKTLGGVVGALLGATAVLFLLGTVSVGLVLAIALGGLFGDLLESMLKRQARVKDAGDWLPGFGGLLDRIDSLLLALPLVYVLT